MAPRKEGFMSTVSLVQKSTALGSLCSEAPVTFRLLLSILESLWHRACFAPQRRAHAGRQFILIAATSVGICGAIVRAVLFMILALSIFGFSAAYAETSVQAERTESPYFRVVSSSGAIEGLPLQSTTVHATIDGIIAHVKVQQRYRNRGKDSIEAIYVLPASTRAAIHKMSMTIGDRVIEANIKERAAARTEYDAARSNGQQAALLEQQRPSVFEMNVANIQPGQVVEVELGYTELITPTDGEYEFVYPAVVGPRYTSGVEAVQHPWLANPYVTSDSTGSPPTFAFNLALTSPIPVAAITSTTHQVVPKFNGERQVTITLDTRETAAANRDLIIRYRLRGEQIQSGLLVSEEAGERFFLLMSEPPARIDPTRIVPREYLFVVDVSGSMSGYPLEITKNLIRKLLHGLRPSDRFNILTFAGGNALYAPA
jgi:Ca-activated chloride channel family protein